jgi:cell division protease FtsH
VFWAVVVLSATLLWQVVRANRNEQKISYSDSLSQVEAGGISTITISRNQIYGRYRDGNPFRVTAPASQEGMLQTLHQAKVKIWVRDVSSGDWPTWLLNIAPLILFGALWFIMIRQMKAHSSSTTPGT